MKLGDTFRIMGPHLPAGMALDTHLWIVLSDPEVNSNEVVIVNVTTWEPGDDDSCILKSGDHPWLKTKSHVNYAEAKCQPLKIFTIFDGEGWLSKRADLKPEVLARVLLGAENSRFFEFGKKQVLIDQGLIEG